MGTKVGQTLLPRGPGNGIELCTHGANPVVGDHVARKRKPGKGVLDDLRVIGEISSLHL